MGIFQIFKRNDRFVIAYVEKGVIEYLDVYNFARYEDAAGYLGTHRDELTKIIVDRNEAERKKEEERLAREREEEEKRIARDREAEEKRKQEEAEKQAKKEEKEKKKQEKKETREKKRQERKENTKKFWANWKKFFAGFLAAIVLLTSGHFIGVLFSNWFGKKDDDKLQEPTTSTVGSTDPTNAIGNIKDKDEALSQENFEKIVAEYSKKYTDNSIDLTTEDLVKFVSIINIDELLEENPEFASKLFGTQTWEAYMDDAMDVIGATYGYNYMTYNKANSTDNFIWVSDCVYGTQKEKMLIVEEYVRLIAGARGNKEEVNRLVTELLERLSSGDLTNLDSGVRFGMNVYFELISSYFAKDDLTKENFDELTTIVEMNLNNIMTEYKGCSKQDVIISSYIDSSYTDEVSLSTSYTKGRRI